VTLWALKGLEVVRILVVDDNEADRQLIEEYLSDIEDFKYEIFGVGSLREANKARALYHFDMIVMDYQLGDGCGLDHVREHKHDRSVPTILLTGFRNRELDRIALEAGADDLLYKNELHPSILERSVRYAIGRFRARELQRKVQVELEEANTQLRDAKAQIEAIGANSIKLAEYLATSSGRGERLYSETNTGGSEWDDPAGSCRLGIWRVSPDGKTLSLNSVMSGLLGKTAQDLEKAGASFASLFVKRDQDLAARELMIWAHGLSSSLEAELAPSNGGVATRRLVICGSPSKNACGEVDAILMSVADITERRKAEASIQSMVVTDPLTGMLNRLAFTNYFPKLLANAERTARLVGVLYVDLDGFKEINDTLGHQAGDQILRHVSDVIKRSTRKSDLVARLGGDEFVIALTNIETPSGAALVARNILGNLAMPTVIGHKEISVRASIGISIYPTDTADPEVLLRYADLALYRRKGARGAGYNFFDPDMRDEEDRRIKIDTGLTTVTDHGEFFLAYQPIVGISSGEILGVEALIRWNHPENGVCLPADFMNVAEQTGKIVEIGQWLLREAMEHAQSWSRLAGRPIPVAINLASRQFGHEEFADQIHAFISRASADPRLLEFEIDEAAIASNMSAARAFVRSIRDTGVSLTLDDFGGAGSSLALLRDVPFDRLKISGSMVRDIGGSETGTSATGTAITSATISLAHALQMKVTGEGIESPAQLDVLRRLNCDGAQGQFICSPLDAGELEAWIVQRQRGDAQRVRFPRAS
jgi:diguanylate cyclase (GGDEF)-like protein